MRVELLTQISGQRNGAPWPTKGTVVDLPDDEAASLVHGGSAKRANATPAETAVVEPVGETTDAPEAEKPKPPAKKAPAKKAAPKSTD